MAVDKALVQPFHHWHRTWKDGAVLFRNELIDLATHWQTLRFQGARPYSLPSQERVAAHQHDLSSFYKM
ncbi:hypothetical protein AJ79_09535 [Helicocarpus griseus UAMH5409]|uniref:Uncharacterized protein n=1 Tax=Helicocarpus griseus UAMH5409 TaxID=1447875 RepID=A0A2B7WII4_9EURO|nr:hypothetical protein AJ79_09535 [Helicocarpus griseus UAMH5409]